MNRLSLLEQEKRNGSGSGFTRRALNDFPRANWLGYFSGKNTSSFFSSEGLPRYEPTTMRTKATVMPITI